MSQPEITLFRVRSAQIGYGRMGVHLGEEVEKQGITVYDNIADAPNTYVLDDESAYEAFGGKPREGMTNIVAWASVPAHARGWWKGQTTVLYTMYETNHLPAVFRENFHEFDTLIVPSRQNQELFSEYHHNVKYVPLGVDPKQWFYVPRTMPTTRFNFLVGGRGQRKGTDLVYEAFREVFPEGSWRQDQPTPYLVMKAPRPENYYGERIEHVTGYIPPEAEIDLYANAHCYIGAARGEGFGLQPLQAIVQGLPTILTGAHGHEAFAHYGMPLESKLEKAGAFVYGDSGVWWEPDYGQLCEYMRYVYEEYAECVERAKENAPLALAEFNWKNTATGFIDAIGRERLTPFQGGQLNWYEPSGKLYKVVLLKHHKADIGGNIMAFEPGEEYRVSGDVKRILFEAGLIDIAKSETPVIDGNGNEVWDAGDHGLLPWQAEKMKELMDRQAYCPTCHQKYGTGQSLTDTILEEEKAKWANTGTP
jgi:hypothetical protein